MKRVVRITAGIMGLWLIVGAGGLAIVRAREKPQPAMLVSTRDYASYKSTLHVGAFGSPPHQRLISNHTGYDGRGWSPDGDWFYLVGIDEDGDFRHEHVWRIRRDVQDFEYLDGMPFSETAIRTADGQGLLDFLYVNGTYSLFRTNLDGGDQENLTPNFDRVVKMYSDPCRLTTNATWTYFCVGLPENDRVDLLRLSNEGQFQLLTANLERPIGLIAQPASGDWAIIQDGWDLYELYIVESDDNDLKPLFPEWLTNKAIYNVQWIPAVNVLIVDAGVNLVQRTLNGFDMTNRRLLWRNDGMELVTVTPDQWLVAILNQTTLVRMRPDGTELAQITAGVDYSSYVGLSPDNQWLLYAHTEMDPYAYTLWGVPMAGGEPHRILSVGASGPIVRLLDWSPDQQWILLEFRSTFKYEQKWVKLDGSEVRPLVEWGDAQFLTWLGPLNRNWQPFGLIGLGVVLEIGLIGWPKKRHCQRVMGKSAPAD